jgi:hypothetical protein
MFVLGKHIRKKSKQEKYIMNDTITRFMRGMKALNEKEYMYNLITYGIAPTICGYKTSTLITLSDKYKNTYNLWKMYKNEFLSKVSLNCFELNHSEGIYTVLFYDEKNLEEKIKQKEHINFLKGFGYEERESILSSLFRLRNRYRDGCPHEIGLFLDIPLEDVLGFIKYSGKNFLYCGYWKVYSNLEAALETFEKYNWSKGKVIELIGEGRETFEIITLLENYKKA